MTQLDIFTQQETRADQMFRAFKDFHRENPVVWEFFEKFALAVAESGREHYSARAIFHRIRWHMDFEVLGDAVVKIGNNHSPFYARMFHLSHPKHDGLFRNRKQTSQNQLANKSGGERISFDLPGDESRLNRELEELMQRTLSIKR